MLDTISVVNPRRIETTTDLAAVLDALVDQWCERRSLGALRRILAGWPSPLQLTDDWGNFASRFRNIPERASRVEPR